MSWGFVIQTAVSAVAIAGLVALAAWARIAAARPPLTGEAAQAVLADEFPGAAIDGAWIAADGNAALARAGDQALVVYLRGDDYVARSLPWSEIVQAKAEAGAVRLSFHDIAAPAARLALDANAAWPPVLEAAA